jgi:transcriptional regulator with XRE-family HTH domain
MGRHKWADEDFGKTVRTQREQRGWSQAEMAKMLSDRGIHPMHPTTVAKIEAGDRSVRINEAVGIADLFEVSVDSLLGRKHLTQDEELAQSLRELHSLADRYISELRVITIEVQSRVPESGLGGIPDEFVDDVRQLELDSDQLWRYMEEATHRLGDLSKGAEMILKRLTQRRTAAE